MLENAYVPRALAHDRSDLVHVETREHAEQDHLGLIARQARTNQCHGGVGS